MSRNQIRRALNHLRAAIDLLQDCEPKRMRHAKWFDPAGRLSRDRVEHLHALFAAGKSTYRVARNGAVVQGSSAPTKAMGYKRHCSLTLVEHFILSHSD